MPSLNIHIECENAAFFDFDGKPDPGAELARLLRRLADHLERDAAPNPGVLHDYNGNDCGSFEWEN